MHRNFNTITVDFIKTAIDFRFSAKFSEVSNSVLNSSQKPDLERTLILSDEVFKKEREDDFVYYLSLDDHTISRIDATRVSDSKIK